MNFILKWVLTLKIVGNAFLCVELRSLFTAFLEHNSPLGNALGGLDCDCGRRLTRLLFTAFSAHNSPLGACCSWRAWIAIVVGDMKKLDAMVDYRFIGT